MSSRGTSISIDISDPKRMEAVHLLQIRAALSIEVKTGLRHSKGSVLKRARQLYPEVVTATTKKRAIGQIENYLRTAHNFDVNAGFMPGKEPAPENPCGHTGYRIVDGRTICAYCREELEL